MDSAELWAGLCGLGFFVLVCAVAHASGLVPLQTAFFAGIPVATAIGYSVYSRRYDKGLELVISAQRILVLVDTEHNTRITAEALTRQTLG
jgi:hypothetical protein